jgi:hypothetical protein
MDVRHCFRFWDRARRAFRRREFFVRDEEGIRYVAISSAVQIAVAVVGTAVLLFAVSGAAGTALYRDAAVIRE